MIVSYGNLLSKIHVPDSINMIGIFLLFCCCCCYSSSSHSLFISICLILLPSFLVANFFLADSFEWQNIFLKEFRTPKIGFGAESKFMRKRWTIATSILGIASQPTVLQYEYDLSLSHCTPSMIETIPIFLGPFRTGSRHWSPTLNANIGHFSHSNVDRLRWESLEKNSESKIYTRSAWKKHSEMGKGSTKHFHDCSHSLNLL